MAKKQETKLYVFSKKTNSFVLAPPKSKMVDIVPWAKTFITKREDGWHITELKTGGFMFSASTRRLAIKSTAENLNRMGQKKFEEFEKIALDKYGESPATKK